MLVSSSRQAAALQCKGHGATHGIFQDSSAPYVALASDKVKRRRAGVLTTTLTQRLR